MQDWGEKMEFCPKCGNLMLPKKTKKGPVLECRKCGSIIEGIKAEDYKLVREVEQKKMEPAVIEGEQINLPTARVTCPKCGWSMAYWWLRQTRAGDEPTTRFYRCTKCTHIWREYA